MLQPLAALGSAACESAWVSQRFNAEDESFLRSLHSPSFSVDITPEYVLQELQSVYRPSYRPTLYHDPALVHRYRDLLGSYSNYKHNLLNNFKQYSEGDDTPIRVEAGPGCRNYAIDQNNRLFDNVLDRLKRLKSPFFSDTFIIARASSFRSRFPNMMDITTASRDFYCPLQRLSFTSSVSAFIKGRTDFNSHFQLENLPITQSQQRRLDTSDTL